MNDWDRLAPSYLSDFFAGWYRPLGIGLLGLVLFGWPVLLWLLPRLESWLRRRFPKVHGQLAILFALVGAPVDPNGPQRSRLLRRLLAGTFAVSCLYILYHLLISSNPGRLTIDGQSLQSLSRGDVLAVVQFLQRWAAIGWALMFITLVLTLNFLAEGWELLPNRTISRLRLTLFKDGKPQCLTTTGRPDDNIVTLTSEAQVDKRAPTLPTSVDLVKFWCEEQGWDGRWHLQRILDTPAVSYLKTVQHTEEVGTTHLYTLSSKQREIKADETWVLTWDGTDGQRYRCEVCLLPATGGGS